MIATMISKMNEYSILLLSRLQKDLDGKPVVIYLQPDSEPQQVRSKTVHIVWFRFY